MRATMIPAFNPGPSTGDGNRTWLVTGARPVLVDAGSGDGRHVDAVASALGIDTPLAAVLVTHAHPDHIAGAPALAARWPSTMFHKRPWPERDSRYGVPWLPLRDGECVAAGDVELGVVHTPGHSPDHLCFWHEPSRTLFGGDLLVEGGTVVIPASRGGRLADYLQSLQRVLALDPAVVLPAHGPPIARPAGLIQRYIAHRGDREAQVLAALEQHLRTTAELVDRIYPRLPEATRAMAEESILAHLVKLQDEGRVAREGDGFVLIHD